MMVNLAQRMQYWKSEEQKNQAVAIASQISKLFAK
jgi:hypothetical protein